MPEPQAAPEPASAPARGSSPFFPIAPERLLLETEHALAFLDAFPVSPGHTLVIPRKVTTCLFDLNAAEQTAVWETVGRVRLLLQNRFHPDAFNIGLNDGPAAGQTIPHAHIHLIPRYRGDCPDPRGGIRLLFPEKAAYWNQR